MSVFQKIKEYYSQNYTEEYVLYKHRQYLIIYVEELDGSITTTAKSLEYEDTMVDGLPWNKKPDNITETQIKEWMKFGFRKENKWYPPRAIKKILISDYEREVIGNGRY